MRDINITTLQSRMVALDRVTDGKVSSLIGTAIQHVIEFMPTSDVGKRLLPLLGDDLLTACEQLNKGKKNVAATCLKMITTDIVDIALKLDITIDTGSKQWLAKKQQIKEVVYTFISQYAVLVHSEFPNDEISVSFDGITGENTVKKATGLLDVEIAKNIKNGGDGVERIEIAGTNAFVIPHECIQKKTRNGYVVSHTWVPDVLQYYSVPDAPHEQRKLYRIKVKGVEHLCTLEEIEKGSAWSYFPDATGTYGAMNKALLANVVDSLAPVCGATSGYITVGWQKTKKDDREKYVYLLENGYALDGSEYFVLGLSDDIVARGKKQLKELPVPVISLDDATTMFEWIYKASPYGHQMISIASQFRSYLNDILPAYTSFFLYSACEGREASRLGKTTIQLASCNLSFPTNYKDTPHTSFSGTSGSIEKKIAQMQSSNCVIDDLNISPLASEKDVKYIAGVLEMIVRTTANNREARTRLKRNLQLAESNMFRLIPAINGEQIPPVLASLERRMISLAIKPNDVCLDMYKDTWEEVQAKQLLQVGHMALRAIEKARNENDDVVRYELQQYEKQMEKRLKKDVTIKLTTPLSQLCEDMPKVYACLLSAMWMLGKYAFNDTIGVEWCERLYPFVLDALTKQVCRMDGKKIAGEKGSLTSLLHIVRDIIASNGAINGQRYRIVGRKATVSKKEDELAKTATNEVVAPSIYREDGSIIEPAFFGSKASLKSSPIFAYVDVNQDDEYVFYLTEIGYDVLMYKARNMDDYMQFKTKQAIQYALKAEDLLARTGKDRDVVQIRLPGVNNKHHYEIKLSAYFDEDLKVPLPSDKKILDLERKRQEKENAKDSMEDKDIMEIAHSEK